MSLYQQLMGDGPYTINKDDDLSVQLWKQTRTIIDRVERERNRERELAELEERVFQRVMKSIRVEVQNQASPAIREIKRDIENMLK